MSRRVLFTSAPVGSHLGWGGYLATAVAAQARGDSVLWVSGAPVAAAVASQGVPFQTVTATGWRLPPPPPLDAASARAAIGHDPSPAEFQTLRQLRALDQWLDPARVAQGVIELDAVVHSFKPDVIVGEMFMAAAAVVAERHGCPFVVAGWPAPRNLSGGDLPARNLAAEGAPGKLLAQARTRTAHIFEAAGVDGVNWTQHGPPALCSPHLHLSYWSPGWFQDIAATQDAPVSAYGPQTVHVGGVAATSTTPPPPDPTLPDPADRPWILITLGTTFNQDVAFFQMAARAAEEMGALPILALGADLGTEWVQRVRAGVPARTVCREWIDFDAVLPYTAAAIHHGGAGTTHAFITHAIPQIVVPHAADQMRQAHGVARTQIGVGLLPQNTSTAALVQLLAQLLPDGAPARARAAALQREFAALGGPPAAAEQIARVKI